MCSNNSSEASAPVVEAAVVVVAITVVLVVVVVRVVLLSPSCHAKTAAGLCRSAGRMGSGSRSTGSTAAAAMEEYRPVVNTLPEVAQLLLGQERHCQGLLDVLQPDQTQGPQVVSVCGAPGAGAHLLTPSIAFTTQMGAKRDKGGSGQ